MTDSQLAELDRIVKKVIAKILGERNDERTH